MVKNAMIGLLAGAVLFAACGGHNNPTPSMPSGAGRKVMSGTSCTAGYVGTVLCDNPTQFYQLNEQSGTTAYDSASTPHNGTYVGQFTLNQTPAPVTGDNGAVSLPGSDGTRTNVGVSVPNPGFTSGTSWTMETWVYPALLPANYNTDYQTVWGFSGSQRLEYAQNNTLEIDLGSTNCSTTGTVANKAWSLLDVVYNAASSQVTFYINGTADKSCTFSNSAAALNAAYFIGQYNSSQIYYKWSGMLGMHAAYATALSASQIQNHYAARSAAPPNTVPKITQLQIFDETSNGTITGTTAQDAGPYYDTVWGAFVGNATNWLTKNPALKVSYYIPMETDSNTESWGALGQRSSCGSGTTTPCPTPPPCVVASGCSYHPSTWGTSPCLSPSMTSTSDCNLTWWQTHQPTWIAYACDANDNPTHWIAYQSGWEPHQGSNWDPGQVPLDISNPAVIQYQALGTGGATGPGGTGTPPGWVNYAITQHYTALAADETLLYNSGTEFSGNSYLYTCGTYDSSGTFHRRWGNPSTGTYGGNTQWATDTINWVKTMAGYMNGVTPRLALLVNSANMANNTTDISLIQAVGSALGGGYMLDETGFTDFGKYTTNAGAFTAAHNDALVVQQNGVTALMNAEFDCAVMPCSTTAQATTAQKDWAIAAYLLSFYGKEDLMAGPTSMYGRLMNYPEYQTNFGTACADMVTSGSVVTRRYGNGFAVINTSTSASASVTLPAGHTYTDLEGRISPVTGSFTVPAADGYTFTTTNGCN